MKVSEMYWALRDSVYCYIDEAGYSHAKCMFCGYEEYNYDGIVNHVVASHYDEEIPRSEYDDGGRKGEWKGGIAVLASPDFRTWLKELHNRKE